MLFDAFATVINNKINDIIKHYTVFVCRDHVFLDVMLLLQFVSCIFVSPDTERRVHAERHPPRSNKR